MFSITYVLQLSVYHNFFPTLYLSWQSVWQNSIFLCVLLFCFIGFSPLVSSSTFLSKVLLLHVPNLNIVKLQKISLAITFSSAKMTTWIRQQLKLGTVVVKSIIFLRKDWYRYRWFCLEGVSNNCSICQEWSKSEPTFCLLHIVISIYLYFKIAWQ